MLNWHLLMPMSAPDGDSVSSLSKYADAFIVSGDDHDLAALQKNGVTAIAIGLAATPQSAGQRAPMVVVDNAALALSAYDYLISQGAYQFAVVSGPASLSNAYVEEREHAFIALARRDKAFISSYRRDVASHAMFDATIESVIGWLDDLPKPIAIFAADESRARLLSQACALAGYDAGSQVLVVGIDSDALAQELSPVPLASVVLDRHELGRRAAMMLQRAMENQSNVQEERVASLELVRPPQNAFSSVHHPLVMRALHYIRLNAMRGIKAEQVAYSLRTSRSSLETRFKQALGRSVHDEILRFKLQEAKQLLRSGASNMSEVAVRCGFTSVQYLYTVFGRELGCTPRVWQDRIMTQPALQQAA
ncbi:MAG: substrate-binding domain-containing protein [Pseudomonadota bacterium]